jgi:acetolactate synthase-1/2/3 large subunit
MLVLTGQVTTSAIGNQAFQEADSFSLMMPITKHNFRILAPSEIPEAIKRGVTIANAGRKGPVHIDLPSDVQKAEVPESEMNKEFPDSPPLEDFSNLAEAIKILKGAERPLLLVAEG